MQRRRSPLAAAVLAVLAPGLGHVYSGQAKRAVLYAWLVLLIPVGSAFLLLYLPWRPWNVILPLLLVPTTILFVIGDAIVRARSAPTEFELRWYNRWYVYVVVIVVAVLVLAPAQRRALRSAIRTFTITSSSMEPALLVGDYVAARMRRPEQPNRGDIVLFSWADDPSVSFIKRIMGLPGDTLEMRAKLLIVNGARVNEPYVQVLGTEDGGHEWMNWQVAYLAQRQDSTPYKPTRDTWGPIVIPPGMYFVLGDNREESLDSRYRGLIPSVSILGRPRRLYFSWEADRGSVRWNRIGRQLG